MIHTTYYSASYLQVLPPRSLLNRWLNQYLASYLDKPPHQVSSYQLNNFKLQISAVQ